MMLDTGKFSRLGRVSKRTLRYYDSIDLLKPTHVDPETGIRYYSARQFADLNRILALKELGMSLDQIRRMLIDNISQEEIHGMLLIKKAEAEQAILDELQRLRSIEARLQNPEHILTQEVVLKSVDEQPFLSYRSILADEGLAEMSFSMMRQVPQLAGPNKIGHFTAVMHGDAYDAETFDAELGFLLPKLSGMSLSLSEEVRMQERMLPAVDTMASIVILGGPTNYPAGFSEVGRWCEAQGYKISGPQREIFVEIPISGKPEEMVIEVQFPVERQASFPFPTLSA